MLYVYSTLFQITSIEVAYVLGYGGGDMEDYIGMNFKPSFMKIDKLMSVMFISVNEWD
jgi:hypothetical protein